jgi:hypothetical protein
MATFKEAFAAARKEKGAGKTFTYKGDTYSTNYVEEEKKPTGTKPKAKPAGLNPQSGAAQSGVAGKVKPKPVRNPNATSVEGKVKPKPVRNPNATSVAGKVKPQMSMMEKAKADAKAAREKSQSAGRGKTTAPATTVPTAAVKPLTKLMQILSQGGFSKYKG